MAENFSNGYQTTLSGAISNTDTTIIVASAVGAPSPNFRLLIDNEYLLVTAVSGTTFTVTRGIESSTASAHNADVTVTQIITLTGLLNYIHENYPTSNLVINSHSNPIHTDTDAATVTFDCSVADWHQITPAGDRTFALTGDVDGQQITIRIIGDGTARNLTWWSGIRWFTSDGLKPTLNSTSGKITVVTIKRIDSTHYDGFVAGTEV